MSIRVPERFVGWMSNIFTKSDLDSGTFSFSQKQFSLELIALSEDVPDV